MAGFIFLDANVFMYAAGADHAYKEPCKQILADVESGSLIAVSNTEVLQEVLYRYHRIQLPDKGLQLCQFILELPLQILPVTVNDIRSAVAILEQFRPISLKTRDAIHAATMQNNQLTRIISADRDFDHLPFVERVDPLIYKPITL